MNVFANHARTGFISGVFTEVSMGIFLCFLVAPWVANIYVFWSWSFIVYTGWLFSKNMGCCHTKTKFSTDGIPVETRPIEKFTTIKSTFFIDKCKHLWKIHKEPIESDALGIFQNRTWIFVCSVLKLYHPSNQSIYLENYSMMTWSTKNI